MPFDWMEPKRNPAHEKTLPTKRRAMYRAELEERAALLHRLGPARARVQARLVAQVAWDFEADGAGADLSSMLDSILNREYGGATDVPRTKGGAK